MILHRPSLHVALTVEIAGTSLSFKPYARVGAAAHVPDDHPQVEQVREVAHAMPGWVVLNDNSAPELFSLLTGGSYGATPGATAPRDVTAEAATAASAPAGTPAAVIDLAAKAGARVEEIPGWARQAAINGWDYDDITGAGTNDDITNKGGRGLRSQLTGFELMTTRPPPGWPVEGKVPWEIPGWQAPVGFVAPARAPAVVPDVPPPTEPDERFRDPEPTDAPAPANEDAAAADPEQPESTTSVSDEDRDEVITKLLNLRAAESVDEASQIITVAIDTPRAENGGPPPRGKVNTRLRNRKLPTLDEDAYNALVHLLPT